MKEKILQYIKDNPHSDGIDILSALDIAPDVAYETLSEMCDEKLIARRYYAMGTYYEIL